MTLATPDPSAFLHAAVAASVATVYAERALTAQQISCLPPGELWRYLTGELWWHTPPSNEDLYEPAVRLMETVLTSGLDTGTITVEALRKVAGTRRLFDFLRHATERNPLVAKKTLSAILTALEFHHKVTTEELYRSIIPKRVFIETVTLPVIFEKLVAPVAEANGWTQERPAPSSGGGTLPLGSSVESPPSRQDATLPSGRLLDDFAAAFAERYPAATSNPPNPFEVTPLVRRKPQKE